MEQLFNTTPLQKEIFKYQKMNPNSSAYNLCYLYKISGKLNLNKIVYSINYIFKKHKIFKAKFLEANSDLFQSLSNDYPKVHVYRNIKNEEIKKVISEISKSKMNMMDSNPLASANIFINNNNYFLLLKFHHSIFDALSLDNLFVELEKVYNNHPINKNENFFKSLNTEVKTDHKYKLINYEKKIFKDMNGFASNNISYKVDDKNNIRGVSFTNVTNMDSIVQLSKLFKVSTFSIITAIYGFILSNMTYSNKVSIGVPFGNRSMNFKNAFGLFVNTLPLAINIKGSCSFKNYALDINKKLRILKECQSVDVLNNENTIFSNSDYTPLNNVITYYNHLQTFNLPGCEVKKINLDNKDLMFPISFVFEKNNKDLLIHVKIINQFKNVNFGNIFSNITSQILNNNNICLDNLNLLSDNETKLLLNNINKRSKYHSSDNSTVIDLFNRMVFKYSDRPAVKFNDKTLTYYDVDKISNRIARFLQKNIKQKYVVVSDDINELFIPLIIAIFKSGKVYVPIDNKMPNKRKNIIFNLLDDILLIGKSKNSVKSISSVYSLIELSKNESSEYFSQKCLPSDDAYILFTSGSTGIPKGVKVTHKNIRSLFESTNKMYSFSCKDVWTLFHSYSFDFSLWEIFGSLSNGSELLIIPPELKMYPDEFAKIIKKNNATIISQTPSAFSNLLKYESEQSIHNINFVKYFFFGGEYISYNSIKKWKKIYKDSDTKFINVYGVTEGSVFSLVQSMKKSNYDDKDIIGKPLSNTHSFIKGINNQILPIGFLGEIVLSGDGIGNKYFKGSYIQNKAFSKKNMFFNENTFYTNDLGYINDDLDIVYVSRNDNQVKISGHRIEIGEIENSIKNYKNCSDAIVIIHEFDDGNHRLIGYYVPKRNKLVSENDIRNFLKTRIQGYMIPQFLIKINKKPLTINGKVNISDLPIPSLNKDKNNKCLSLSEKIINIWENVLNRKNISQTDNFFDVGGSSLLITEVYYKILKEFNLSEDDFSMIDLFEYSTPKKIATFIKKFIKNKGD